MALGKSGSEIINFGFSDFFFWFKPGSCFVDNAVQMATILPYLNENRP